MLNGKMVRFPTLSLDGILLWLDGILLTYLKEVLTEIEPGREIG